jgi:hydrogenase maturation protein HypF
MAGFKSYHIKISGIVQGVGFRPHVYRLATEYNLTGWVLNSSAGVFIEVEGKEEDLQEFARRVVEDAPPLAVIRNCSIEENKPQGFRSFTIRESESLGNREVMISPDIAICEDCKREVRDPADRRYTYPFINCTNCGPRFTIIKDIPYDRAKTTMAPFPMCRQCQQEYEDPLHRRFHAQPNACPVCGPHTTLVDENGRQVDIPVVDLLKDGKIVAVKGLGGFHLAADATNVEAIKILRQRKRRDAKPFAVMARDLEAARRYACINPLEEKWLNSPQAPIVILESNYNPALAADIIHPGLKTLGVMLPYTPIHYLLFNNDLDLLIMTSANISDEPLIIDNDEALNKLKGIADYFLMHNREIYNPCDDSVMMVTKINTPHYFRRARGFVPLGIQIPPSSQPVLAVGGEMKNTFCLTRGGEAFLSQHWGDLNHYLNYRNFLNGIERFENMLSVKPEIIAHDLHPNYQTTRWARQQQDFKTIAVQHHFAHMAAVMAEHHLQGEVLGLISDGTGWGTDGAIWGCEVLKGDYRNFERRGHLKYLPLPGGDLTAQRPYRMALVYLLAALGESKALPVAEKYLPDLAKAERDLMLTRITGGKEILTSSCGRLFDAVGAMLGICPINHYEGQAAIELEAYATKKAGIYSYNIDYEEDRWIMNPLPMWPELLADLEREIPAGEIAYKFHLTMVEMFTDILQKVREESGLNRVVLSGGVFHNQILLVELLHSLQAAEFEVYHHQQLPPGDGGLSLGQAIIASEVIS